VSSYFAHSENNRGQRHGLVDHLQSVANKARRFAEKFGAGDLGYWSGLWHDLGKFHPDFAAYLAAPTGHRGPDHSSAGMVQAASVFELLACPVAGHHSGLDCQANLKARLREKLLESRIQESLRIAQEVMPAIAPTSSLGTSLPAFLNRVPASKAEECAVKRACEMFIRILFSALVDADFLDTEAHFSSDSSIQRRAALPLAQLQERFDLSQAKLATCRATPLNRIRDEIYHHCLTAAKGPRGFYRLTVPTGGGKTRSGMGFGLSHAIHHGLDRVTVAIPFTSIIEQTADVYRSIFGAEDGAVLEHHSAIDQAETSADPVSYRQTWARLAAENWDAPIIVTTTVQLFESLFANRPGRCRKLHNLARSVIILDEVQTLPYGLLEAILDSLRQLVENYGATVVLCTATQPALSDGPYLRGLRDVHEIIPDPARYFAALNRVQYEFPPHGQTWTWQQVADCMGSEPQALAILNTKKDALSLLDSLDDPDAMHISTLMCGAHRRSVLRETRRRLDAGEPCRLVSTQVVEAGVDLDFPMVLRAIGPLDRIVQAAGRCNREGELASGRVVIFRPAEGTSPPGDYRTATNTAETLLEQDYDLADPQTYEAYFRLLFQAVDLDKNSIQTLREQFDFPEVASRFRMIPDDSVPVVACPDVYRSEAERLLRHIADQAAPSRFIFRRLQPYLVNVPSRLVPQHQADGLMQEIVPGLWQWLGRYDEVRGLSAQGKDPETLVI
jgi:CRISPR-associated endonuclease/helicase Cas3